MLPFQSYYSSSSSRLGSSMEMMNSATTEKRSVSASKSHSEAEKRRRDRINGHLRTLRTLLPNTIKTDKASLLAEVVHKVRELKKLVADEKDGCSSSGSREWPFPGETDEMIMSYDSESGCIKVTMSCEDRVELVKDLSHAVKTVRGRVVKAEMSTIGGRTKSELVIEKRLSSSGGGGGGGEEEYLSMLRRALKSVVDKPGVSGTSQVVLGNKRQRLSHHLCQS